MLRIWRCDCALCVIGNEFPCRQPHNPSATLLRGPFPLPQGQKPLAVSRRKTPDDKMISWKESASNFSNDFVWYGHDTSRLRQIIDIQYNITIMGGRKVSRPYRVWFFAEGERFLSFWRCHRPRKRAALVMWCG